MEDVFMPPYWLSKLKRKCWSEYIIVDYISINWRLWVHIYNQKWYCLPWLQHGGCIVCLKRSHTKIQLPVRKVMLLGSPDFEMLLTNGLLKEFTMERPRASRQTERTHGLNQRTYARPFIEIFFHFQGLKRTLGTLHLLETGGGVRAHGDKAL